MSDVLVVKGKNRTYFIGQSPKGQQVLQLDYILDNINEYVVSVNVDLTEEMVKDLQKQDLEVEVK